MNLENSQLKAGEMGQNVPKEFDVDIDPIAPLFIIGVASDMVQIPIWTLRKLDEMGVVCPKRIGVRTRCYSQVQIKTLNYIKYLLEERSVNISGIKVILEIEHRGE
ncbi:MAG: MerR family transcriptional regulator [Candidatus Omnitrophica bacterium]|nr:MerR family transcriptional regulator [Candidatus Omnitrophota bacterium]